MRKSIYSRGKPVLTPEGYILVFNYNNLPERDKKAIDNYEKRQGNGRG
ncbi:hypothetical protein QO206_13195 [Leeuwenhoekiella aequorea]|tara:strand:+ start:7805 stop:7948 length:144 start_codon:yes stop_codon:yes gene_type:complete